MTNSYTSIELQVSGPNAGTYVFSVDATDTCETELVNLVSSRGIGDTFAQDNVIVSARGGYCENYAQLGILLLDPQGNVAYQFPTTRLESSNAGPMYPVGVKVGLNYQLVVTTTTAVA